MSQSPELPPFAETFAKPEALMRVPVGLVSPLWGLFAGMAIGGSAWWWMTRWTRPENLEAMFGAAGELPSMRAFAQIAVEPAMEAAEAAVEAVAAAEATALEAVAADIAEAEALIGSPEPDAPVGGEAAPIAPAVAASAPKPRAKKAEPKPD